MLEIYNYVIGILIGILFSFSNHNESKIIIIKNCLITTVIYAISMSFINDYFLLSSLLKLIYFTICFMLIRKLNFFQSYYNSLIIVLFYLLSYVFLIFMLENSTQFSIFYSANIDCIAIFMSLMAFYYLNELSFLNNSVQFNIYDLVLIILINIILFIISNQLLAITAISLTRAIFQHRTIDITDRIKCRSRSGKVGLTDIQVIHMNSSLFCSIGQWSQLPDRGSGHFDSSL